MLGPVRGKKSRAPPGYAAATAARMKNAALRRQGIDPNNPPQSSGSAPRSAGALVSARTHQSLSEKYNTVVTEKTALLSEKKDLSVKCDTQRRQKDRAKAALADKENIHKTNRQSLEERLCEEQARTADLQARLNEPEGRVVQLQSELHATKLQLARSQEGRDAAIVRAVEEARSFRLKDGARYWDSIQDLCKDLVCNFNVATVHVPSVIYAVCEAAQLTVTPVARLSASSVRTFVEEADVEADVQLSMLLNSANGLCG